MSRVTEKRTGTRLGLLALTVAVLAVSAASCRTVRPQQPAPEPQLGLGDRLVVQLERRTDVRHVWLVVAPIERTYGQSGSCVHEDGVWVTEDRTLDRARAERIRERIIEEMASRVHVVELPLEPHIEPHEQPTMEAGVTEEPETVNAVLVARFDPAANNGVRVRARILDRRTREILAVAETTMR